MKTLLMLLGLTAFSLPVVSQFAPDPPGPVVVGKKGVVVSGDTLTYTVSWGPGARATSYNVTWAVAGTNGTWAVVRDSNASGNWVSGNGVGPLPSAANVTFTTVKTWVAALPWDSATFTVTVASKNAIGVSTPVSATWKVSRKPGVPGPIVVDSSLVVVGMIVRPNPMIVAVGQAKVVCAFPQFGDGAIAMLEASRSACDTLRIAVWKSPTPAQQLRADGLCITFASSNLAVVTVASSSCALGARRQDLWVIVERNGRFVAQPPPLWGG